MARRQVRPEERPCRHRGGLTRKVNGKEVFTCARHGRCSLGFIRRGIKTCIGCADRDGGTVGRGSGARDRQYTPPKAADGPQADVAVVVVSHNYGVFLPDAVESVLNQTLRPAEIVIIDDASTDETPEVAARYRSRGVDCLRCEHGSPHKARAEGFRRTSAGAVCFLDADDRLPPRYLEEAARRLRDKGWGPVGIVQTDLQCFGDDNGLRRLDFDSDEIERKNTLHAGCLVSRAAVETADAFSGEVPFEAHEDWRFFRRILQTGWKVAKSPVPYLYRRHAESRCRTVNRRVKRTYWLQADLQHETITLFIALSGRRVTWPFLRHWLETQTWPRKQIRLVLYDSSGDASFGEELRQWAAGSGYPDVRVVTDPSPQPGLADRERGSVVEEVQLKTARIYNQAVRETTTEYLWIVEDDVVPPPDAAERLLRSMRGDVFSVSARVDSRLHPGPIAWDRKVRTLVPGNGVQEIGGNGFGCVILRRSVLRHHVLTHRGLNGNFDQELYRQVAATELRALIDWDVRCEHLDAPKMGPPARFVIVTPGRCGSQLLSEALDAHFAVKCWHEVLNPVVSIPGRTKEMDGRDLMELIYRDRSQVCGFKAGLDYPVRGYENWATAWDWLVDHDDVRVIWLTRRNWLAQHASAIVAKRLKTWHHRDPQDPLLQAENRPRIRLEPEEVARAYRSDLERLKRLRGRFDGHPSLDVTYEELVNDWAGTTARAQRFLDVPVLRLPQSTVRGERRSLKQVIENYEQVTAVSSAVPNFLSGMNKGR